MFLLIYEKFYDNVPKLTYSLFGSKALKRNVCVVLYIYSSGQNEGTKGLILTILKCIYPPPRIPSIQTSWVFLHLLLFLTLKNLIPLVYIDGMDTFYPFWAILIWPKNNSRYWVHFTPKYMIILYPKKLHRIGCTLALCLLPGLNCSSKNFWGGDDFLRKL